MNDILDIYTDYLISQNDKSTATGLSKLLDGQISHDKITRFLNQNNFTSKNLWQYIKSDVRKIEQEQGGVLIVDDCIAEKPYTDENKIVCWHFSHAKGRHVKGINILSSLVRYVDISFPIAFEIITKDLNYYDPKTEKERRKSSITKNQQFRELIKQAISNQVKFDYILADNWFGAKDNMEFMHYELHKMFVLGIKSNRLIAFSNEERKRNQYHNLKTLERTDGEKSIIWLKDLAFPVALVTKIFKNEDGSTGILHIVTNDLDSDAEKVYEVYQKRWRIEEYHKSIKQNTSLAKSPTKVICSQQNHIFASIIAYCKLEFLKIRTTLNHFALKYKLILRANQIAFQELRSWREKYMSA